MAIMLGAGHAPAGSSRAGFGSPATRDGSGTVTLPGGKSGLSQGSRFIDPATKQYLVGTDGRVKGAAPAAVQMQIAATTVLNSSAVRGLGVDRSSVQSLTDGVEKQLAEVYRAAFARLIAKKLVEIRSITVNRLGANGAYVHIRWKDLTTGLEADLEL